MTIYSGKYLTVFYEKENSLFIQQWSNLLCCVNDFKSEMLQYVALYKQHKPCYTLWLQQDFSLILEKETYSWIEKEVNIPCVTFGNKKCAFVVGRDVFAHVTVLDSFEETKSVVVTKHFLLEKEARSWLLTQEKDSDGNLKPKIVFEKTDSNGDLFFKIENAKSNVEEALKLFRNNAEEEQFSQKNLTKFITLSRREKEILKFIAEGKKHTDIAQSLFISIHTVRTHWRNIKSKLNIKSAKEVHFYLKLLIKEGV